LRVRKLAAQVRAACQPGAVNLNDSTKSGIRQSLSAISFARVAIAIWVDSLSSNDIVLFPSRARPPGQPYQNSKKDDCRQPVMTPAVPLSHFSHLHPPGCLRAAFPEVVGI
jgi:hypothetical protein